tara:strand:+ start:1217 stop:1915 length:699 start_codon:yes stop_codon:yes gene_type:complete
MLKEYISNSSKRATKTINSFSTMNGRISVYIKDPLPKNVSFKSVFVKVRKIIPDIFFLAVDSIHIGLYDLFIEKSANAMYEDGKLFITSDQKDEKDMVDDIVHEVAHSLEDTFIEELYSDGMIKAEFLGKRNKLLDILEAHGYNIPEDLDFGNVEFSQDLDDYLYREIGYSKIANHIRGLFLGPYSTTSIHEYFAEGFEDYFMNVGSRSYLKILYPILYRKIEYLERKLTNA